jgi:hypothetical protein
LTGQLGTGVKKSCKVTKGKKAIETDTATYPFWAFNWAAMEIFQHDEHGRQTGPAETVSSVQEAHDICEARNYPDRKGKA